MPTPRRVISLLFCLSLALGLAPAAPALADEGGAVEAAPEAVEAVPEDVETAPEAVEAVPEVSPEAPDDAGDGEAPADAGDGGEAPGAQAEDLELTAQGAVGSYGVNLSSASYQSNVNPFFASGYGGSATDGYDGECTWYAWGRAHEKLGVRLPCRGNANSWTSEAANAGFRTGTEARANSIMVEHYSGTGHVFFVERVENGKAYVTEGNWLGYYHEDAINLSTMRRDSWPTNPMGSVDYIYLEADPIPPTPDGKAMAKGYDRILPDGDYAIVLTSTLNSSKWYFLDIEGGTYPAADLTNVSLYDVTGSLSKIADHDLWHISYSDGFYTVTQKGTGAALDVEGASDWSGTNVQAYHTNGSPSQQWAISRNGGGYRLEARCSGFSLDVDGGVVGTGVNVQVWTDNSTDAQRWSFVPAGELCDPCEPILPDGDYAIVLTSTLNSSKWYFLDIEGGTYPAADLTNVSLYDVTGSLSKIADHDLWHISYSDGFYTVTQKGTGAALDVAGAGLDMGTNVQAYHTNGSPSQQWAISRNGGGYRLEARCSGFSLDVDGGVVGTGVNVQVWSDNSTDAQRWSFVPAGRDVSSAAIAAIPAQTYTGSAITPAPAVTLGGTALVAGTDYTVRYSSNVDAGTATVTVTGKGAYTGTKSATFTIARRSLSGATVAPISDLCYLARAREPEPAVTLGGRVLVRGRDYDVSYSGNVSVGTATVTVKGTGNYTGTKRATFSITIPFSDVTMSTPHAGDIGWLAESGISTGWVMPDGTRQFRPMNTVIRQDMAAFLFRVARGWGLVDDSWRPAGKVTFADVTPKTPHYREIMWLAESGVSAGWTMPDGTRQFRPTNTVIRQDMAAFLRRMWALRDPSVTSWRPTSMSYFTDVSTRTPHYEDIAWLQMSGISSGWIKPDGTIQFRPTNAVVRQDMAAFLYRLDSGHYWKV